MTLRLRPLRSVVACVFLFIYLFLPGMLWNSSHLFIVFFSASENLVVFTDARLKFGKFYIYCCKSAADIIANGKKNVGLLHNVAVTVQRDFEEEPL